jgi:hypothetical protein
MTVKMILSYVGAVSLHAGRRVTTFFSEKSLFMPVTAALIIRAASRDGIIRLTFTA